MNTNPNPCAEQLPSPDGEPETTAARDAIDETIAHLRRARELLSSAKAHRAADRVRRALKSVEAARRNAERFRCRACDGKGRLDNPCDLLGTETCPSCAGTGRTRPERGAS